MTMLKFLLASGLLLVAIAIILFSPWNLYLAEGWAHCSECHSTAHVSRWVLGNPDNVLVWAQKPEYRVDSPGRSQKTYFDTNHEHNWKLNNHWFRKLWFTTPSLFVTEPDFRNEFAIKYNNDRSFGDWVDLQVDNGQSDPEEIREIFRARAIDFEIEPSATEDRVVQRARELFQSYRMETDDNRKPNHA